MKPFSQFAKADDRHMSEMVQLFRGEIPGPVRVATIRPEYAMALGATTNEVFLSKATLDKQNERNRGREIYRFAQRTLQRGMHRLQPGPPPRSIFLFQHPHRGDRFVRAVLKATDSGTELYLVSIHLIRPADLVRYLKLTKEVKVRDPNAG